MNLRHITARAAVAGTATALLAGGLVTATGVAANADAGAASDTYTCTIAALSTTFDVTLDVTSDPGTTYWAGSTVAPGTIDTAISAVVPAETAANLGAFGVSSAHVDKFAYKVGAGSIPTTAAGGFTVDGGVTTWNATGSNEKFTVTTPGTKDVVLPSAFDFVVETADFGDIALPCVLADGQTAQSLGSVTINQQTTKTTAKALKGGIVQATVQGDASPAAGSVKVLKGKTVLGSGKLKNGVAKINVAKKLSAGKNKLKVVYAGTPSFAASSASVTVTK